MHRDVQGKISKKVFVCKYNISIMNIISGCPYIKQVNGPYYQTIGLSP